MPRMHLVACGSGTPTHMCGMKGLVLCVFISNCIKKGEDRGYKSVTLETIMNTKADKAVKKITHHVPSRQMIYTKKQIGLNHEKR